MLKQIQPNSSKSKSLQLFDSASALFQQFADSNVHQLNVQFHEI